MTSVPPETTTVDIRCQVRAGAPIVSARAEAVAQPPDISVWERRRQITDFLRSIVRLANEIWELVQNWFRVSAAALRKRHPITTR